MSITYFASHGKSGRGLSLRLALILGGIKFEDTFVTRPEHYKQKENNNRRWAGVPEITIFNKNGDKQVIGQSSTCLRYAGYISGLYPKDDSLKAALIDEILDSVEDLLNLCFIPFNHIKDENQKNKFFESLMSKDGGKMRAWFDKFELRLKENNVDRNNKNGYFVGDKLTIADLKLFGHLNNYFNGRFEKLYKIPKTFFIDNGYKRINELLEKLRNEPKIKTFIEEYDVRLGKFHGDDDDKEKYRTTIYDGKVVFGDF